MFHYNLELLWSILGFLQQTDFSFPLSMVNLYLGLVRFAPSLPKQSQYFLIIAINCYFISGITIIFNLICLCSPSLCSSSLNVVKFYDSLLPMCVWVCILPSCNAENQTLLCLCHLHNLGGVYMFCIFFYIPSVLIGSPSENLVLLHSLHLNIK